MTAERKPGFDTLAIHAGAQPDPATGARATPIYQTTSFVFDNVEHAAALFNLETFGNIYTRIMNPTQAVLEERVAALEGGTAGLAVASGHAAQALVFHTLLAPGDEFIAARQLYGGSINQFTHAFKKCGWEVRWADTTDADSFRAALTPKTKAIFVELIANPGGIITDLEARCRGGQTGGRAVHRRQHAGHALSHAPDRAWRRHHRAFADQVPWRSRQLDRRRHRRLRHVRLVEKRPLSDALGPLRLLSRHHAGRDFRQFCLRHRLPRAGLARSRPGDLPLQRLPRPHRDRDLAAPHAASLRQRTRRRHLAVRSRPNRVGELRRPAG